MTQATTGLIVLLMTLLLSACSSVDSVRVFDDKQAAMIVKETYPSGKIKYDAF